MNKTISTGVGIAIIAIVAAVFALGIWKASMRLNQLQNAQTIKAIPVSGEKTKSQACLDSGGSVTTAMCCGQTQNFPNSCLIGACGCAPTSSHQVKTCQCGEGKCFDGNACVDSKLPAEQSSNQTGNVPADWKNYTNQTFGIEFKYPKTWKIDQERSTTNEVVFNPPGSEGTESREALAFRKNTKNLSLEKMATEMMLADPSSIYKKENLTIAGEKALKEYSGEFALNFIVFLHKGNAFMITTQGGFTDQIIGTIKFTN